MSTRARYALLLMIGCAAALGGGPRSARAQEYQYQDLDIERYKPLVLRAGALGARGARGIYQGTIGWAFWGQYVHNPLLWRAPDGRTAPLVKGQWWLQAALAYAPWRFLELQAVLPFLAYQHLAADTGLGRIDTTGLGDLRLSARVPLALGSDGTAGSGEPFAIAAGVDLSVPTGSGAAFVGDQGIVVWPTLSASLPLPGVELLADLGYKLRRRASYATLIVDDELNAALGVRAPLRVRSQRLQLAASLIGQGRADALGGGGAPTALEALAGAAFDVGDDVWLQTGLGIGLSHGYGVPDFRLLVGLYQVAGEPDSDGDGLVDSLDRCPLVAEDYDGVEDDDGCPEDDADFDGIPDQLDRCPTVPEDPDGIEDDDGCPEVTKPDRDGDGIEDDIDYCPDDPEDKDGFMDGDGCPDLDNDEDGVPDDRDRCPNERETINGFEDEDGCPDEGAPQVEIVEQQIVIAGTILFQSGKATIRSESLPVLDQVAQQILAHPRLLLVRIEGHTDALGSFDLNMRLSQQRAESVVRYLVEKGVGRERMRAVGFGPQRPIASNATERGRTMNRRVEFHIEKLSPAPARPPPRPTKEQLEADTQAEGQPQRPPE